MNDRLRWRLAKLVILSWARKEHSKGKVSEIACDVDKAYEKACIDSTLLDELMAIVPKWGTCIEKGIQWINGDDDTSVLSQLNERDRMIVSEVTLIDHKRFLNGCFDLKEGKPKA